MCIRVCVYIYVVYGKNMCMYGHRPHMDLPQGPLRDIAIIMFRYADIYICQKLCKYHGKQAICILKYNHNNMQVKLKVPKTKVKFWPPLQDIHCHGNHLSFGKALMLEKHKQKSYFEILWEGPMEQITINMEKTKKITTKNNWRLFGEGPRRKVKTHGKKQTLEKPKQ